MNIPSQAAFFILTIMFATTVVLVLHVIPRQLRTLYRLELWRLRDEFVDDLVAGRIRKSRPAIAMLNLLEHAIEGADRFTISRALFIAFTFRNAPVEPDFLHDGVPDAEALRVYRDRLTEIRVRWFARTSALGWIQIVWLPPLWLGYRLALHHRPLLVESPTEQVVTQRVDESGKSAMKLDRVDPVKLAHCV